MSKLSKLTASVAMILAVAESPLIGQGGGQQTQTIPPSTEYQRQSDATTVALSYWTAERMASVQPMPVPMKVLQPGGGSQQGGGRMPALERGAVNGLLPGGGNYVEQRISFGTSSAPQTFGTAPTDPLNGPYGPFQRWTMEGSYIPAWRAIHGKLFFTLGGTNFVCSATVIGRSTVATAGHCNSDGAGSFATNRLFCPSYYNPTPTTGAPFPGRGCWGVTTSVVGGPWHNGGDPDYDYACLVMNTTGDTVANKIGNVTGWAGRAWNFTDVPEMVFGYPQAAPFHGNTIQQVSGPDWYSWDATPGNQVSKIMGNDLTGGASGGGWFIGWRAPTDEIADTDGSNNTDPGTAGPFINGVNSHKRCRTNCNTPPTATAGIFWQEMSSPPFRSDANDASDSEDVFAICLAHANNN